MAHVDPVEELLANEEYRVDLGKEADALRQMYLDRYEWMRAVELEVALVEGDYRRLFYLVSAANQREVLRGRGIVLPVWRKLKCTCCGRILQADRWVANPVCSSCWISHSSSEGR